MWSRRRITCLPTAKPIGVRSAAAGCPRPQGCRWCALHCMLAARCAGMNVGLVLCPLPPGFTAFMPLVELRDPARALLVDDTLHVKVCGEGGVCMCACVAGGRGGVGVGVGCILWACQRRSLPSGPGLLSFLRFTILLPFHSTHAPSSEYVSTSAVPRDRCPPQLSCLLDGAPAGRCSPC